MEIAVRLQDVPAFERLSTQQLVGLAEVLTVERYDAEQAIYSEGDEGTGLYFILEGEVVLRKGDLELERLGPGRFFGELSTLDGVPRPATATAERAVQLLCLEREELLVMMEDAPALAIGISQFLALQVRALQDRLRSDP